MSYAELPARAELRPWIAAHWHFRVAAGAGEIEHRVPLTGGAMVHVHNRRPGAPIVTGPRVTPLRVTVRGGDEFWGTHLWPGAAGSALGVDAEALREAIVPLGELVDPVRSRPLASGLERLPEAGVPAGAQKDAARLLDDSWSEVLPLAEPLDERVMRAVFQLVRAGGEKRIRRLAAAARLSPRHFRRRFRAAVGLSPKELARLRRLRSSAAGLVLRGDAWVRLAADHGYADQAHLVREYRSLLGVTPTAFGSHAARIAHGRILS